MLALLGSLLLAQLNVEYWFFSYLGNFPDYKTLGPPDDTDVSMLYYAAQVTSVPWKKSNGVSIAQSINFALRATGFLRVPTDTDYEFALASDDGSILSIDGTDIIRHGGTHVMTTKRKTLSLTAGDHTVELLYFQSGGGYGLTLSWNSSGSMNRIGNQYLKPFASTMAPPTPQPPTAAPPNVTDAPPNATGTPIIVTGTPIIITGTPIIITGTPAVVNNTSVPAVVVATDVPAVVVTQAPQSPQPSAVESLSPFINNSTFVPTEVPAPITTVIPVQLTPTEASVPSNSSDIDNKPLVTESPIGIAAVELDTRENIIAIAGPASIVAPTASRLLTLSGACHASGTQIKYPYVLHPTQWTIRNTQSFGLVIGNLTIITAFAILSVVALQIARSGGAHCFPNFFYGLDTQGFLRIPSAPLILFRFFYQGLSLAGFDLLFHPFHGVGDVLLGGATTIVCIAVPVVVMFQVKIGVPKHGLYRIDPTRNALKKTFLGPGEWVSRIREHHWVLRYTTAVLRYREKTAYFDILQYSSMMAVSAISVLRVENSIQCGHAKLAASLIMLIMLLSEGYTSPYAARLHNVCSFVILGQQFLSLLLMAVSYYIITDLQYWLLNLCARIFFVTIIVLASVSVVDFLSEVYIIVGRSRRKLQEAQWSEDPLEISINLRSELHPELSLFSVLSPKSDFDEESSTRGSLGL